MSGNNSGSKHLLQCTDSGFEKRFLGLFKLREKIPDR